MYKGGEKLQEAYYIFQELIDKYGVTALLLNNQSVCYIGQGEYIKAEDTLQDALEKDSNDIDSLINSLFISTHLKVSVDVSYYLKMYYKYFVIALFFILFLLQVVKRQLNMLRDAYPNSDFINNYNKKEAEFDVLSQVYQ